MSLSKPTTFWETIIPIVAIVILIVGAGFVVRRAPIERSHLTSSNVSAPTADRATDTCPPPVLSLHDFQDAIQENWTSHAFSGTPTDEYFFAVRGLVDIAVRCRHFSIKELKLTPEQLKDITPQGEKP